MDLKKKMNKQFKILKAVLEGVGNYIYRKEDIEELSKERFNICKTCPLYTSRHTNGMFSSYCDSKKQVTEGDKTISGCGCQLELKTRVPNDHCPLDKWNKVITHEVK